MRPGAVGILLVLLNACSDNGTAPVPATVESVVVSPSVGTLDVGQTLTLSAVARSAAGQPVPGASLIWSSRDTMVAAVSAGGVVTARGPGSTVVTAASGARSGTADISVRETAPAAPVVTSLSPQSVKAGGLGLTLTVTGAGFTPGAAVLWNGGERPTEYMSASQLRASVLPADVALAGLARVRVVGPTGVQSPNELSFTIDPQPVPVASVELRPGVSVVTIGRPVPLTVVLKDASGAVLTDRFVHFLSSNDLVGVVGATGVITAKAVGDAEITAWSGDVFATMSLTVTDRVNHLVLDGGDAGLTSLDMAVGGRPSSFWGHAAGTRLEEPSVSPDGRYIAYVIAQLGTRNVALLDQATRTYQFLTTDNVSDQPSWSPAGDRIAFRSVRHDRSDVWSIRPDGTDRVSLTAGLPAGTESEQPAWSGDGGRIVFSSGSTGGERSLYVMNADGSNVRRLTFDQADDTEPTWNGDRVVFTRSTSTGASDLWTVTVSGVGPLMPLTASGKASMPAWSPDGRWIAYVERDGSGPGDVLAMRWSGGEVRPVSLRSDPAGGGLSPAWLAHN